MCGNNDHDPKGRCPANEVSKGRELEKLTSPRSNWCHSKGIHYPLPPNSPFAGSFRPEKIDYRRIKGN